MFCKNTIEEDICKKMSEKIKNIAQLNDGDLLSHQIEGLTDDKTEVESSSTKEEMELGKMFMRMEVLETRKKRLLQELKETEDEMKGLQKNIQDVIG
jgi:hypothetical protein